MSGSKNDLYGEDPDIGNWYREKQKIELDHLIKRMRATGNQNRAEFFRPDTSSIDTYEAGLEPYREKFKAMLGWPLSDPALDSSIPIARVEWVAQDRLSKIYRVMVEGEYGLTTYGLLFLPLTEGPFPLVISQHGGEGTPELCSSFYGPTNYHDMTRRVLQRNIAVFAPQLLLWKEGEYGPPYDRASIDRQLKQVGSSIAAVEIYKIQRSLDYLLSRNDIAADQVGMIGLSYGGFYTLFTAAADTRIKAAYSSCFFNDRFRYDWSDFTWFNAGNKFLDAEIAGLICPRFLHIEVGKKDELFHYAHALKELDKLAVPYGQLNIMHRLSREVVDGAHELDINDRAMEWFCQAVRM
ncbi:dienelactone hydrolase family protein [Paenibacillus sp. 2TAB26]|uniref:dienelactone hydrolase family protein n=1 Tax=Paenibacillus sp. 2TAB26 TaxID=3233005 RepID=UPI003F9BDC45